VDTQLKSKALDEFKETTGTLVGPAVREWKEQGRGIIGYTCSAVPAELITAAGFLPFRMRATGSTGTELSDAYYSNINCSFPRHCLNLGLRGDFDFLSGLIVVNSCDHVRRIYDNWKRKVETPFIEIMSLPKKRTEVQVEWYRQEIDNIRQGLEKQFGIDITEDRLREAIRLHNETRRLQRQMYELRKRDNPPITGAEALATTVAATAMPVQQYNELLRELVQELEGSEGKGDYDARLMIVGSILDDPPFVEAIEEMGGLVVTDSLCYGTRLCWVDVDEDEKDPLKALAQYYVADRPSCARTHGDQPRRLDFIKNMVRDFKVDGVIGERMAFCDLYQVEHYMLDSDLREADIPFLKLEREYVMSGGGQLATRVQAFVENLGR
jgi:bzd-type benzoyl-CoA reductase N subunit